MTIANKYALLLFKASTKDKIADQAEEELSSLQQAIFLSPKVLQYYNSPSERSIKESLIVKITTQYNISTLVTNFMKQIIKNNRIELLPEIIESYNLLMNNKKLVEVTSARKVDKADYTKIERIAEKEFGSNLEIQYNVEEDLIGGMIIRCGNSSLDASIAGMLKRG